jgi:hypothetical protein
MCFISINVREYGRSNQNGQSRENGSMGYERKTKQKVREYRRSNPNGQSRENGNIGYERKTKQKHNTKDKNNTNLLGAFDWLITYAISLQHQISLRISIDVRVAFFLSINVEY